MQEKSENITKTIHRLHEYITHTGITFNKLAIELGLSNSYFSKMLKSGGSIGSDIIENILRIHPDVNANWLLTGIGSMTNDMQTSIIQEKDNIVSIPIVDIGAAAGVSGYPNSDYLEIVDSIEMPYNMVRRNAKYFCIRIKGDSMAPTMLDSGYLIIRLLDPSEWQYASENHVYVVSTREGIAYVKRIKNRLREHGFIVCMSDNPDKNAYGNFNLYQEELNTLLHVEWYFTAKMPNIHETYYKKVEELEDKYELMDGKLNEIISKLR